MYINTATLKTTFNARVFNPYKTATVITLQTANKTNQNNAIFLRQKSLIIIGTTGISANNNM
jgi:dihydrodipicolinate reductase